MQLNPKKSPRNNKEVPAIIAKIFLISYKMFNPTTPVDVIVLNRIQIGVVCLVGCIDTQRKLTTIDSIEK